MKSGTKWHLSKLHLALTLVVDVVIKSYPHGLCRDGKRALRQKEFSLSCYTLIQRIGSRVRHSGETFSREGFEMYLRDLVWRQMLNLLTIWVVVTVYRGGCRGLMMAPLTALIRDLIRSFEHLRCLLSIYLPVSLLRVAKDVCSLVSL